MRARFGRTLRFLQVRLRFLGIVAVLFLLVGKWDVLQNHWSRALRWLAGAGTPEQGVSADTQYFCPMCPGVLSFWPAKCPVCNMPLVRRESGDAPLLPEGVTARMQFSPYRLQLAGICTAPVEYRALQREVVALGVVRSDEASNANDAETERVVVEADLAEADAIRLAPGNSAAVISRELPALGPWSGKVTAIEPQVAALTQRIRVRLSVECPRKDLLPGSLVEARFAISVADLEPFRSLPRNPPPRAPGDPRSVYACPDHADVIALRPGKCPRDELDLAPKPLADNQRVAFWCPMHPSVTATENGHACQECRGMKLLPRIITYAPSGQVLAAPESAMIDTGEHQIVYVEIAPGMFDGVAVKVGPRAGGFVSIVKGLEAGQRVAAVGAFLVDAETRLNPHLAAAYFGAGKGAAASPPPSAKAAESSKPEKDYLAALDLSPADRALAERQRVCPVTKLPLGSMGALVRVEGKDGRVVFLCCEGCRTRFEEDERKGP